MVTNRYLYHHIPECINGCIATSIIVVGTCCVPAVGKIKEHKKHCLSSQQIGLFPTRICKLSPGERKKEITKVGSTALAGQKETTCHEVKERESRHIP